ncbi:MAG: Crp/Fnr family transcriptional regulator [Rikenellaceae bacterium]
MYTILAECPLFRGLRLEQIEMLLSDTQNFDVTEYKDADIIARRETAYSGLMIILEGAAQGVMIDASHSNIHIDALEAPSLIAPAFLFGGYNRLPIDVVAKGDVKIMTLHRGFLFELMQSNMLIMSNFIDIISDRANVWSKKIYYLSFRSLREKLAKYLIENSSEANPVCDMPDAGAIAQYFDSTRSALITVVQDMEQKNLVSLESDSIVVLDRAALESMTDSDISLIK